MDGKLTDDGFLEDAAWKYMIWFYGLMDEVMIPSASTRDQLVKELEGMLKGYPAVFTGFLGGPDLQAACASSDVFVFPSTTDTFGNVVLEAQASGIPVIVSDEGGPRELMRRGETGVAVPGNDRDALVRAMRLFLENPALARDMGRKARAFTVENDIAPGTAYGTILRGGPRNAVNR